jgi:hypothetical protein
MARAGRLPMSAAFQVGKLGSVRAGSRSPSDLGWEQWLGGGHEHRDAPWFASVAYVIPQLPWVCDEKYSAADGLPGCAEDLLPTVLDLAAVSDTVQNHLPFTGVSLRPAPRCCRRRSPHRRQAAYSAGGAIISASIRRARTSGEQARSTRTWRPPVPASQRVRPASSTVTVPPRASRHSSWSGPLTA